MFYLNFDNTLYKHHFAKQAKVDDFIQNAKEFDTCISWIIAFIGNAILQNFHSVYGYFNCHPWYNEGNLCPDQEQIYQNSKSNATLRA